MQTGFQVYQYHVMNFTYSIDLYISILIVNL